MIGHIWAQHPAKSTKQKYKNFLWRNFRDQRDVRGGYDF